MVNDCEILTFNKTLPPHSIEESMNSFVATRTGGQDTEAIGPPRLLRP
jgi:hypothetical protein